MIRKTRLYTPGPTPLLPAAQFAMAAADMHHRTPEFRALFQKVLGQLKIFVGTQNDVLLLSSSGTGAMEAAVVIVAPQGGKAIVLESGKFAERWRKMCETFGIEVIRYEVPWGEAVEPAHVRLGLCPYIKQMGSIHRDVSLGRRAHAQLPRARARVPSQRVPSR